MAAGQAVIWTQTGGTWGVAALPNLPGAASARGPAQARPAPSAATASWPAGPMFSSTAINVRTRCTWSNNSGRVGSANDLSLSSRTQYPNPAAAFAATAVDRAGTAVGWGYLGGTPTGSPPLNAVEFSGGKTILLGGLGSSITLALFLMIPRWASTRAASLSAMP